MLDYKHMAVHAAVGAGVGLLNAASVDYAAFRMWKSFRDAAQYDWGVALWRWLQGAVIGAVGNGLAGGVV